MNAVLPVTGNPNPDALQRVWEILRPEAGLCDEHSSLIQNAVWRADVRPWSIEDEPEQIDFYAVFLHQHGSFWTWRAVLGQEKPGCFWQFQLHCIGCPERMAMVSNL